MQRGAALGDGAGQAAGKVIAGVIAEQRNFLGEGVGDANALLPILHALQAEFGYIDPALIPQIADALNISGAEVRGVTSFYHDYRSAPAGDRTLRLCRAEACQAMGCERIADHLFRKHGLRPGETTPDGGLTLENVYCLGNCALGPAALLDGELIGRVDEARIDTLVTGSRS